MDTLFAFAPSMAGPDEIDEGCCPECGYTTETPGELCLACVVEFEVAGLPVLAVAA